MTHNEVNGYRVLKGLDLSSKITTLAPRKYEAQAGETRKVTFYISFDATRGYTQSAILRSIGENEETALTVQVDAQGVLLHADIKRDVAQNDRASPKGTCEQILSLDQDFNTYLMRGKGKRYIEDTEKIQETIDAVMDRYFEVVELANVRAGIEADFNEALEKRAQEIDYADIVRSL